MDKNAIKKFAVWARRELISRVSQRALLYGISEKGCGEINADSVNGHLLTPSEKKQRQNIFSRMRQIGFEQTIEEAAYTWFNRFSALRFMEVNGYLPSHVRVFTDEQNAFKPQILAEAIHLDMDGLDMEKVYALKNANKTDELYKYLLIVQCNALGAILPGMFTRIEDYTELLFPDNLLREGSVIEQMISMIPEDDWKDAIQIIGWLYQYYNAEPKDKVFENLKKNIKISKENIPAATQLFTPDWIVRYMVENSLGRLWVEGHPNDELKSNWKYYLEEAEQEPEVQAQLAEIRREYAALKPEEIKVIDPCMGSGHILVYMFDVLVQIYEAYGYNTREAAGLILQNNLYGLDIDDRAAQLAYFAVMMKARQYDRRIFSRGTQPHVYAIVESNGISGDILTYFENGDDDLKNAMETIVHELHDAKEYGSILNVTQVDFAALYARLDEIKDDINLFAAEAQNELRPLIEVTEVMAREYHAVVTNPPYMGQSGMTPQMSEFIKNAYPDSKADLFAIFIERCGIFAKKNGVRAMITQHGWMFLGGYERLRTKVLASNTIVNMAHLGARAFDEIAGEVVQTTAFVIRNCDSLFYRAKYIRLTEEKGELLKEKAFFNEDNVYLAQANNYGLITGQIIAYWLSPSIINMFRADTISNVATACKGLDTGDNDRFLRFWHEVESFKIGIKGRCQSKWIPYNKGGGYRKWYGLNLYVIDWENDGYQLKYNSKANIRNEGSYFKPGLTWSDLSTNLFGARYFGEGFIFDASGPSMFSDGSNLYGLLGYINSNVYQTVLNITCPGLHYNNGAIAKTPVIGENYLRSEELQSLTKQCVQLSKTDWDSFELSWDFKRHPLIQCEELRVESGVNSTLHSPHSTLIKVAYENWEKECNDRFNQLKKNEEELNATFIDIYGLQDELTPEVDEKDVTVRKADLGRDIRSLISYAVGCMFGRYSLDCEGLAYAGGEWDVSKYTLFPADKDNIIPICDDEYFDDDIVARFVRFIETVYGKATLEENLRFIADALGGKGTPRDVIRSYFLNDFYADHLKVYQKRPIYWLFDSGKKNGFKALIYMHRYQPDTIARIRTDYVHEQQARYRTAITDLENRIAGASTSERVKLNKQLAKLQAQADEIHVYEEKIHHLADMMIPIDLDDGVKHNYELFADVLAKIK